MKHRRILVFGIIGIILMIGIASIAVVFSNPEIKNRIFSQMGEASGYEAGEEGTESTTVSTDAGVETQADADAGIAVQAEEKIIWLKWTAIQ